ncbi:ABC transporter permease subunit [Kitasatospora sp. NPDC057904]|uniref:ABC transporter permease subunit n=1 Tax=Kitasatospora sp. NPDC057904 TaxID=3346275 RepID=UPI0036DC6AC3
MRTELLAAEWIKLRSVRSTHLSMVAAAVLVLTVACSVADATAAGWPTMTVRDRAAFDPVSAPLFGAIFAQLVVGVLGVLTVSAEYTTGLIRTTFATTPQRLQVLTAKVVVAAGLALVSGVVILGASFLLSQGIMAGRGGVSLTDPGVVRALAYAVLYIVIVTVLGTALAAILRATAGAIAVLFTLVFLVPQALDRLPDGPRHELMRYGLQRAAAGAVSIRPQVDTFSPTVSILVCAAYAAVALGIAFVLVGRRDV